MEGNGPKNGDLVIKWISNKDAEMYEKSLVLREQELRIPLGMKLDRESLKEDNVAILIV
jgi:hypothetical protein